MRLKADLAFLAYETQARHSYTADAWSAFSIRQAPQEH